MVWECGDDDAVVTLTNSGGESATGTILKNGNPVAGLSDVAIPGVYDVPIVAGDENSTVTIAVDFSGSTATFSEEIEVDCFNPVAAVQFSCAEGGVLVKLTNSGVLEAVVEVNGEQVDGAWPAPTWSTRSPGSSPWLRGTQYDITVLGQNAQGTRNCEEPEAASIELDCAEGGVVVVLTNDGELPANVTVNGRGRRRPGWRYPRSPSRWPRTPTTTSTS